MQRGPLSSPTTSKVPYTCAHEFSLSPDTHTYTSQPEHSPHSHKYAPLTFLSWVDDWNPGKKTVVKAARRTLKTLGLAPSQKQHPGEASYQGLRSTRRLHGPPKPWPSRGDARCHHSLRTGEIPYLVEEADCVHDTQWVSKPIIPTLARGAGVTSSLAEGISWVSCRNSPVGMLRPHYHVRQVRVRPPSLCEGLPNPHPFQEKQST